MNSETVSIEFVPSHYDLCMELFSMSSINLYGFVISMNSSIMPNN